MSVLLRIILLLVGYAFGLIETGVLYGKIKGVDLRQYGSKNAGTTNALRVLGPKAGIVVFIGDFCKSFIPCLTVNLVMRVFYPDTYLLYVLYIGFGAVLGHIFPFYLGFKGGKGIATTGGAIVGLLNPWMILILLTLFVIVLAVTKYMSVASITLMTGISVVYIAFLFTGLLPFDMSNAAVKGAGIESMIIVILITSLAIYKHKANIIRLINKEENKFTFKKTVKTD